MITTMHKTLTVQRRVFGVGWGEGGSNFFTACGVRDGRFFTTSAVTPPAAKKVARDGKINRGEN